MIGYKLSNRESAQVTRNIETKEENSARPMPTKGQLEASRKEKYRIEGGISTTRIDLGETVIIPCYLFIIVLFQGKHCFQFTLYYIWFSLLISLILDLIRLKYQLFQF